MSVKFTRMSFQYRFAPDDKEFSGHAIGNLIIAALTEMQGDVYSALDLIGTSMKVRGKVLPASEDPLILQAHYQDGSMIEGETTIVSHDKPIDHVSVRVADEETDRKPRAGRGVVEAVMEADMIILGPGSLYTSILPNLVIDDIRQAVLQTPATVAYVCNIMTQLGETEHFSDADHLAVVNRHLGENGVDAVLINSTEVPEDFITSNSKQDYLVQVSHDQEGLEAQGAKIYAGDLLSLQESGVYHDQDKLVDLIQKVYQDNH